MNFLNGLKKETNYAYTENGALTHKSTLNSLMDLFAMGGAYRYRSDEDCIILFKKAFAEDETHAMKCLFYLRDIRGGQGERRFFKTCMRWLAFEHPEAAKRNLEFIPIYGRYDDLYLFVGTPLEEDAFNFIRKQLALDIQSKTPSLLAKWLKSENTSSSESRRLGNITRKYLNMSHKQYRKTLSILRARINILEKLMSENRWDEIEFDKIPSKAGMIYRNAFAKHDVERAKKNAMTYAEFAKDTSKKVNAEALYPYECVHQAMNLLHVNPYHFWSMKDNESSETNRLMINKYWDNLTDYFKGAAFNGIAMVDTSGSMTGSEASAPINVAISLGMYCAEKADGPFHNHFLTFESNPHLIEVEGIDFCDKVKNIYSAPWGGSTNVEKAFDLLLQTAINNKCPQENLPKNLIIISDMEFDYCVTSDSYGRNNSTLMEKISEKWKAYGYDCPKLVFWNVNARNNNIPILEKNSVSYVSGMSPVIFEMVMTNKTGLEMVLEKLDSERYKPIH